MRKHRNNPITEGIRLFHGQIQQEATLLEEPFSNIALRSPNTLVVNRDLDPSFYARISSTLAQKPQLKYQIGRRYSFYVLENIASFLYIIDQAILKSSQGFMLQSSSGDDLGIYDFFLGFHQDSSDTEPKIKVDIEDDNQLSLVVVVQTPLVFTGKSKIKNLANKVFDAVRNAVIDKHYSNLNTKDIKKLKLPTKTKFVNPPYDRLKNEIHTLKKGLTSEALEFKDLKDLFRVFESRSGQELDSQDVSEALLEEATESIREDSEYVQDDLFSQAPMFVDALESVAAERETSVVPNLELDRDSEVIYPSRREPKQEAPRTDISDYIIREFFEEGDPLDDAQSEQSNSPEELALMYEEVDLSNNLEDTQLSQVSSYSESEVNRLLEKFSDDIAEANESLNSNVTQLAANLETQVQLDPSLKLKEIQEHIHRTQEKLEFLTRLINNARSANDLKRAAEELEDTKEDIYEIFQRGFQVDSETNIDSNIINDITLRLNAFADYYNLEGEYVYDFRIFPTHKKVIAKYDGGNAIDVTLGPKNTITDIVKALAPELHDMWSSEEYDFDDVRIDPYLIEQELLTLK